MNKREVTILIAEDDPGHALLIKKNLKKYIANNMMQFGDGKALIDFLYNGNHGENASYILLLDIDMPEMDGIEVLKRLKTNEKLKKIPVIMLTTTDDPKEVERCYSLGCNVYITKPIDYDKFVEAIERLGLFTMIIEVPGVNGDG